MKTRLTELLGIAYPVIQGGMAGVSDAQLTAAVSEAGGLGVLNSIGSVDAVRENIRKVKQLTSKPFAVNIMLLMKNAPEMSDMCMEEGVKVLTTGAGSPKDYVAKWKAAGIKVIPVVPSAKVAKRMEELGCDAVVCSGTEAGGHVGETTTMSMVPVAARICGIPVVAAGGIGDGRGVAAAFAMGAEGVQCGTAFIVADECSVSDGYKNAIVEASESDTLKYVNPGTGKNVRGLATPMVQRYVEAIKEKGFEEAKTMLGNGLGNAVQNGDPEKSTFLAGQSAGSVVRRASCKEIIETMMSEAREIALAQAEKWK